MTAFVELPLVSEAAHRTVWVNPAQVGSVEQGAPTKPGTCWVTMVWGCRHQIALPMDAARRKVDGTEAREQYLQARLSAFASYGEVERSLRESVRGNLTR